MEAPPRRPPRFRPLLFVAASHPETWLLRQVPGPRRTVYLPRRGFFFPFHCIFFFSGKIPVFSGPVLGMIAFGHGGARVRVRVPSRDTTETGHRRTRLCSLSWAGCRRPLLGEVSGPLGPESSCNQSLGDTGHAAGSACWLGRLRNGSSVHSGNQQMRGFFFCSQVWCFPLGKSGCLCSM